MDLVKYGVVGCGTAAAFHLTAFKKKPNEKVQFVAAHDINAKQLKRFCRSHKLEPYGNLDDLLHADIDAVLIMLPHYLHADVTKKVAEAGKHILCEKPMAPTLEECDDMINAAKKAGVKLMIAENHRFLPVHEQIKKAVEKGLLGDIYLGRTYEGAYCDPQEFLDPEIWHFCYDKGGGGVVADQGVHKFAALNWILDDSVEYAQCWMGKALQSPSNKGEDNAIIIVQYKKGAMVEVTVSSTTIHPLTNKIELHGTRGSIFEDHSWEKPLQIYSNHPDAQKIGEYYYPEIEHGPFPEYYLISAYHEDTYFSECILQNKNPIFTPEQSKEAVAVVLLSYLSSIKGERTSMKELLEYIENNGSYNILDSIKDVTNKNYEHINWK